MQFYDLAAAVLNEDPLWAPPRFVFVAECCATAETSASIFIITCPKDPSTHMFSDMPWASNNVNKGLLQPSQHRVILPKCSVCESMCV